MGAVVSDVWRDAVALLLEFDGDLIEIVGLSLTVSLTAVGLSAAIAVPLGAFIATHQFYGRSAVILLVNTLMGLPPVLVGLVVYLWLSASGPLGSLQWLYTPAAMIVAQTILVAPILTSLTRQAVQDLDAEYDEQMRMWSVGPLARATTLIVEARAGLATAVLAGFGRAIAEVGAVLIVGGNINHVTRTMTTAIALETSKGELALAIALGIVLLVIAVAVNAAVMMASSRGKPEAGLRAP